MKSFITLLTISSILVSQFTVLHARKNVVDFKQARQDLNTALDHSLKYKYYEYMNDKINYIFEIVSQFKRTTRDSIGRVKSIIANAKEFTNRYDEYREIIVEFISDFEDVTLKIKRRTGINLNDRDAITIRNLKKIKGELLNDLWDVAVDFNKTTKRFNRILKRLSETINASWVKLMKSSVFDPKEFIEELAKIQELDVLMTNEDVDNIEDLNL